VNERDAEEELTERAEAAILEFERAAGELARVEAGVESRDGRVAAWANGTGEITRVRLRDSALRTYRADALGTAVAAVLRAAQEKAREAYVDATDAILPPEVAEVKRIVQDAEDHRAEWERRAGGTVAPQ
jgi:DNA-binding protein YbaB